MGRKISGGRSQYDGPHGQIYIPANLKIFSAQNCEDLPVSLASSGSYIAQMLI